MNQPICYYIPAHVLANINLARAKDLSEPGLCNNPQKCQRRSGSAGGKLARRL